MSRLYSHRDRHFDLGSLPTERLDRDAGAPVQEARLPQDATPAAIDSVNAAFAEYQALFAQHLDGPVAPAVAPLPEDLLTRSRNLKASAYFLDATLAGVCELEAADWIGEASTAATGHRHALVFAVEFGREPGPAEPGAAWIRGCNVARTNTRAAEVAVVLAGYLRALGYPARGHVAGHTQVSIERLLQRAGVARADGGRLRLPFIQRGFAAAVVTTTLPLAPDVPIAATASLDWPDADAYMGKGGTRPGWQESEERQRPLHLGRYAMETIRRVPEPTTLILHLLILTRQLSLVPGV